MFFVRIGYVLLLSLVLHEFIETLVDLHMEIVEVFADFMFWESWAKELHSVDLGDHILWAREGLLNESHGDLLVSLGGLSDNTEAVLVELNDSLHHASGLVKWAVVVIIRETVLLEELILDNLGGL